MLYTSRISKDLKDIPEDAIKIAITRKEVDSPDIYWNPNLAPTWDLINGYKNGEIDSLRFGAVLFKQLLADESAINTLKLIKDTAAVRDVYLLCYCSDVTKCHRLLIARLLESYGVQYGGEC